MNPSDPSDAQLVAPALLQLTRAGTAERQLPPYEACPSPACGLPITSFPDCLDCKNAPGVNLQCDSCWTACASPCDDDECDIPQPCYDEHCAVESCVDSACAADSCTDVTCPETVHCNATCFDNTCLYSFGGPSFEDEQICGQGNCFGFLPSGPSIDNFGASNDMLIHCPLLGPNQQFGGPEVPFQHDHIDGNRHKRRRIQNDEECLPMFSPTSSQCWSNPEFPGFSTPLDSQNGFPEFDFCDYHHERHDCDWMADFDILPPCDVAPKPCLNPHHQAKRRRGQSRIPRLVPTPKATTYNPIPTPPSTVAVSPDGYSTEHSCRWVLNSGMGILCGHSFSSAKELDEHIQQVHTSKLGPQSFVCSWQDCDTTFKHRGKLNRHISGAHSKYHAHICSHVDPTTSEVCGRTFCTKEQLKNHETIHTGERKYKCRFCDHTSATKTQHNTHERIHTKEKPYQCPWCGHKSGDSSNLSKHVRNKHPGMAGRAKKSMSVEAPGGLLI